MFSPFFRRIRSYRFPLSYPMIIVFGPCIRGARWTNVEKQQCSLFTKSLTVLISQVWQVVQIHDMNPQQTWMIMNICCAFYSQTGETLCKMIVNQLTQIKKLKKKNIKQIHVFSKWNKSINKSIVHQVLLFRNFPKQSDSSHRHFWPCVGCELDLSPR